MKSAVIVMLLSALSFAGPKEMQNLQSCKYEIVLPCQDYKIKVDGYDEGIIYYYYFKDGGVIIITEGSLLEFDFETLEPLACSSKTAIGMIGEKYWRRDNVGGKVRAYYVNVPENSKKSYDASLNSIILSRQESWSKGPRNTCGGDDPGGVPGLHQQVTRGGRRQPKETCFRKGRADLKECTVLWVDNGKIQFPIQQI